ncbi:MAG TPA: EamA family transporter [Candidatus Eisenbacteria bacterium]
MASGACGTLRPRIDSPGSSLERPPRKEPSIASRKRLAAALVTNQLIASGTHIVAKGAMLVVSPLALALLRFITASGALLLYQRFRSAPQAIARRDWPMIALLGILVIPINQGFFLFGLSRSTASHAALLYALTPLLVLLFARGLLREGGVVAKLAGILVAFAGVAVILLERGLRHEMSVLGGDLLILVAVVAWALYTVLSKRLLHRYDPMTVTTWAIVSGTVLVLPALAIPGAVPPLPSVPPAVWGAIGYLAIGTSVIGYPLWMYALRHMDASKVAVTSNTQPILTAALSWLVFRERFTPGFLTGAALILAGVTWVETRRAAVPAEAAVAVERV